MDFNFEQARKALDLTQKQFADRYNMSLSTYRKWEQGKSLPRGFALQSVIQRIQQDVSEREHLAEIDAALGFDDDDCIILLDGVTATKTASGGKVTLELKADGFEVLMRKLRETEATYVVDLPSIEIPIEEVYTVEPEPVKPSEVVQLRQTTSKSEERRRAKQAKILRERYGNGGKTGYTVFVHDEMWERYQQELADEANPDKQPPAELTPTDIVSGIYNSMQPSYNLYDCKSYVELDGSIVIRFYGDNAVRRNSQFAEECSSYRVTKLNGVNVSDDNYVFHFKDIDTLKQVSKSVSWQF